MKKYLKCLILGVAAGIAIGLGGSLFVICKMNSLPILGGFLFSIGLLFVCTFKFNLFTGKIGYVLDNKKEYLLDLLIMFIGNFIGAIAYGYLFRLLSYNNSEIMNAVNSIANNKVLNLSSVGKSWYELILSSICCGSLVYIAVNTFKNEKYHIILRILVLVCAVAAFVILGFDHCIANMFYFASANVIFTGEGILSILLVTLGNSIGAIILNYLFKLV